MATTHAFCDISWIFRRKIRDQKKWKNLWNIFSFIFHVFFCLILHHPGFYSSLSDNKRRNSGSSKISKILVKCAKNGCRNDFFFINSTFLVRLWQYLPLSQTFLKCCHFFVFYRSVNCKSRMIENHSEKKHGISRKIYFIDFSSCFASRIYFLENPWNITKSMGCCQKTAH